MRITVHEAARRAGVSARRIQVLCKQGRVNGAILLGRVWMVPSDFSVTPGRRGPALRLRG